MNILYILGNGFDLAQGMASSYSDFYNYLNKEADIKSESLKLMREEIDENITEWSDMETALGKFSSKVTVYSGAYPFTILSRKSSV